MGKGWRPDPGLRVTRELVRRTREMEGETKSSAGARVDALGSRLGYSRHWINANGLQGWDGRGGRRVAKGWSGVGGVDACTAGATREGGVQARSEYRRKCGDRKAGRGQPSELYTTDEIGRSTSRAACVHETVWTSVRDSRHGSNVSETSRPTSGVSERATAPDLCMSGLLRRNIQFNSIRAIRSECLE